MNQVAQTTFVFSEGDCAGKLGLKIAATAVSHQQLRAGEKIPADHTLRLANRLNRSQAFGADRDPRNSVQWGAAEPAIGWEQDGENIAQKVLQGRDKNCTLLGALGSPFSL